MTTSRSAERPFTSPDAPKLHPTVLGHYRSDDGHKREVRCLHLADGRRLVVDWRRERRAGARLVGELAAEEPAQNAAILARVYLEDDARSPCRALRASDLQEGVLEPPGDGPREPQEPLRDRHGLTYRLRTLRDGDRYPELRWTCGRDGDSAECLSLREVVGRMESYEPAFELTRRALAQQRGEGRVSVTSLRAELQRMETSPFVLNRRLREVLLARVESGLSLSEIAQRCGRSKPAGGGRSGETTWVMRRIGARAEHGKESPTPWIHSDVLALIARMGLGLAPLEAEAA